MVPDAVLRDVAPQIRSFPCVVVMFVETMPSVVAGAGFWKLVVWPSVGLVAACTPEYSSQIITREPEPTEKCAVIVDGPLVIFPRTNVCPPSLLTPSEMLPSREVYVLPLSSSTVTVGLDPLSHDTKTRTALPLPTTDPVWAMLVPEPALALCRP